jgi:hypothetical protein
MSADPNAPLVALAEELQQNPIDIVGWKFSKSGHTGRMCLLLQAAGNAYEAEIEAVWPTQWAVLSAPAPGVDAHYKVCLYRREAHNICFPHTDLLVTTSAAEVMDGLRAWSAMPAPVYEKVGAPIDAAEIARVGKLAKAMREASAEPSFVVIKKDLGVLGALTEDEQNAMKGRISGGFPREDDGRLMLGATLLLQPQDPAITNELLRSDWLAAVGPVKRKDPQVITVGISSVIPGNHPYRWDTAEALWNPRLPEPGDGERRGVAGLDLSILGLKDRDKNIAALEKAVASPKASDADRVALCILLQDAGRFGEAFALFGLDANDDVWRVVSGQMLHAGLDKEREAWTAAVQDACRFCAPWLIKRLMTPTDEAADKKRKAKTPRYRLFALPHQPQVSKTSLMLTADNAKGANPRFELEGVGSNTRLAEILWKRPIDMDIQRFGL